VTASGTIFIGNERLRDVYMSKRISEPGLRRVMVEYARGGNVEQVLQQEIHNKELTYERDPRMRKQLAAKLSAASEKASTGKGKLGQHGGKAVEAVKPALAASAQKAKSAGQKAATTAGKTAKKLDNPNNPMQQVVVRTWAVVTVVLAIIVVI